MRRWQTSLACRFIKIFALLLLLTEKFNATHCDSVVRGNRTFPSTLLPQIQCDTAWAGAVATHGLVWHELEVQDEHDGSFRLYSCSGVVPSGQVCGILGPSGAGKTSLLSAIAGISPSSSMITGQVWQYSKQPQARTNISLEVLSPYHIAWLEQRDNFFEMLTVQETLRLAAYLELPHLSETQRHALVKAKIQALGLSHVVHTRVQQGLSGGERRRLSVALELVSTDKRCLLADEPTTGLDTSMSRRVMQLIQETAVTSDIPALAVIHQPRSAVWHALDVVVLVAEGGRVCYSGPRKEALAYFVRLGYPCPVETNPAEFLVDLVAIHPDDTEQAAKDKLRIQQLANAFTEHQIRTWEEYEIPDSMGLVVNKPTDEAPQDYDLRSQQNAPFRMLRRFGALARRSWRQNIRDRLSNVARIGMSLSNAYVLAQLFPTVRGPLPTANSLADRAALLTVAAFMVCNMAYMKSAYLLEKESPVVWREQVRRQYSSLEYLLAKVVAELPLDASISVLFSSVLKWCTGLRIGWSYLTASHMLLTAGGASLGFLFGSFFATYQGLAVYIGFPFLVVLVVVGVINPGGVDPRYPPHALVSFFKYLSPFVYAVNAALYQEFKNMKFVSSNGAKGWLARIRDLPRLGAMAAVWNGDQVLDALGLAKVTYWESIKKLGCLTASSLFISWIGLVWQQWRNRRAGWRRNLSAHENKKNLNQMPIIRRFRRYHHP